MDRIYERFEKILKILDIYGLEGLLLNAEPNVSYACGFHAPDSYALITAAGITLITDFRYKADFQKKITGPIQLLEYKGTFFKTIARLLKEKSVKHAGFESRRLTFAECEALHKLAGKTSKFIPLKETVEPLREIKDAEEIKAIREAVKITLKALSFIEKILKPGMKELEAAAELERFIRMSGAEESAFKIIVASGPNSSYPHAEISSRRLKTGEPVVIDMGVAYNGYKCDLTRTFFLGKINPSVRKVESIVREAQHRAIRHIRPGIPIKEIDFIARNYIAQKGFAKFFGHSLGHGIGLEVHESPSINKRNTHRLKNGSVFTIEPGIYMAGEFGVRIEDMVLVTKEGAQVLSGDDRY